MIIVMSEKTTTLLSDVTIKGDIIEKEKLVLDSKVDGEKWVLIDNTDQVSEDGILFADARFHLDSDSNVITKTPPTRSMRIIERGKQTVHG